VAGGGKALVIAGNAVLGDSSDDSISAMPSIGPHTAGCGPVSRQG
jgi:hypothetical protein